MRYIVAKTAKTLEELQAEANRLWDVCEDLFQQAHAAERKAKAATTKFKNVKEAAKIAA